MNLPDASDKKPEFHKPGIVELFGNIDRMAAAHAKPLTFLNTQLQVWAGYERQLERWCFNGAKKSQHPFGGELDAFDMAIIQNAIAARIERIRASRIAA